MPDDDPQPLPALGDIRPGSLPEATPENAGSVDAPSLAIDPAGAPLPPYRDGFALSRSLVAAFAGHALVALALFSNPPPNLGSDGNATDAISVSIVSANALETQSPAASSAAAMDPAPVSPTIGEDQAISTAALDRQAAPQSTPEPPPAAPIETADRTAAPPTPAPEVVPEEAPVVTTLPTPPQQTPSEKPPTPDAAVDPPPEPSERADRPANEPDTQPAPNASAIGGAPARGTAVEQSPQPAAAAALSGKVVAYGLAIQSALLAVDQTEARSRMAAARASGTVVVRIAIRSDGSLEQAEVVQSSGRPQLDAAALRLIRLTKFPAPPPELTAAERIYLAPIRFR
jgi:protein TonB